MSSQPVHRSAFEEQAAHLASRPEFAAALPVVVLSLSHPAARSAPRIRRHLALPPGPPAAPRRTPAVIDGDTLQPDGDWPGHTESPVRACGTCYARPAPAPIADAARVAPPGSRFLAWVGRNFGGEAVEIVSGRPVIDVQATEVR